MPNTQPSPPPQVLLSWKAPIHPSHERSARWYLLAGGMVLAIAVYSVIVGAWSVALVDILIGAVYFLLRDHTFPDATISIADHGIQLNDTFLHWNDAAGYWFLYTPDYTELHIEPKNPKRRALLIQTGSADMRHIRETLGAFMPELTEKHERLLDAFIRICKL